MITVRVLTKHPAAGCTCILLVLLAVPSVFFEPARGQGLPQPVVISVDDPRPVAKIIEALEERHGWIITYEDPPYQNPTETEDLTHRVRKDGKASPKVIGPRGGAFTFTYEIPSGTKEPVDPGEVLQMLLTRYEESGNPGFFRATRDGSMFHILPAKLVNEQGVVVAHHPILDSLISLPGVDRTPYEMIEAVVHAVSATTGTRLIVGALPLNVLNQARSREEVKNEVARSVLVRTLSSTGRKLSWQLFYDPGMKMYALNLHLVSS